MEGTMENVREIEERELYRTMIAMLADPDHSEADYEELENEVDRRVYAELKEQLEECTCEDGEKEAILKGFDADATWHLDAVRMVNSVDELQSIKAAVAEYLGRERTVYSDSQETEDWRNINTGTWGRRS
jgi:hypothetical protein